MLNKSELLEALALLKVSGETHWDETGCSVDEWNPFQTRMKLVLVLSVDRPLVGALPLHVIMAQRAVVD